jgi:apolipoprotein N-acyltransferase
LKVKIFEDGTKLGSDLSDTGVACIVFLVISLGLLIAGFVVHNNTHYKTNKFIKISTISIFIIFAIALILALAGKVDVDQRNISETTKSFDVSI